MYRIVWTEWRWIRSRLHKTSGITLHRKISGKNNNEYTNQPEFQKKIRTDYSVWNSNDSCNACWWVSSKTDFQTTRSAKIVWFFFLLLIITSINTHFVVSARFFFFFSENYKESRKKFRIKCNRRKNPHLRHESLIEIWFSDRTIALNKLQMYQWLRRSIDK